MKPSKLAALIVLSIVTAMTFSSVASADPIVAGFNSTPLPANDDGSTGSVSVGFLMNFLGVSQSTLFVNNNGDTTFTSAFGTYTPQGLSTVGQPIIAPFFADVDTRAGNVVTYGTGTFTGHGATSAAAFGVNWPGVGYYSVHTDKLDTFQLVLVSRSDVSAGDFDIYFNYGNMLWETGDASGGVNGFGGSCPVVGYSNGTVAGTVQIAGSAVCGAFLNGGVDALNTGTNDNVPGQLYYQVRNGAVVTDNNPPPVTTPEPGTFLMLSGGVFGLIGMKFRKLLKA